MVTVSKQFCSIGSCISFFFFKKRANDRNIIWNYFTSHKANVTKIKIKM